MNREERLRRELPEHLKGRAAELASLAVSQVDLIVAGLRASHREGREHEAAMRRQRKADARRHDHYREEIAGRNHRLIAKQGERARAGDLDQLASLAEIRRLTDEVIIGAMAACRARGVSDEVIAATVGMTRQGVWKRLHVNRVDNGSPGSAVTG